MSQDRRSQEPGNLRDSAKLSLSYEKTTTSVVDVVPEIPLQGASTLEASITVLSGAHAGEFRTFQEQLVIGRDPKADLPLRDQGVSWHHCRFERLSEDQVVLEDLRSTNGTWRNRERVVRPVVVEDGDRIQLGAATAIRFSLQDPVELEFQKEMYESALMDGLTGLYNHRYFSKRLPAEFEFARRQRRPLSLCLLDLDLFKRVNDTYGHPAGDEVLRTTARIMRASCRLEDTCCRYGGEEFAIICREIDSEGAVVLAERIRNRIEALVVPWRGQELRITVSAGVAGLCPSGESLVTQLVSAADEALYAAKHAGRNQVKISRECF